MVRWATIILAVIGFSVAMIAMTPTFPTPPDIKPERMPAVNPFTKGIAALGVVECADRESNLAAPVIGIVAEVHVKVGQTVNKGDVLFTVDDRVPRAELLRARAAVPIRQAAIDRWHALPRAEDLPPLEAAVASAKSLESAARAELASREDELARIDAAFRERARSEREVEAARFSRDNAAAKLAEASAALARAAADLDKAKAGGWKPDLAIAQAELNQENAALQALEIELDRYTVRAPRQGTVLRRDIEPGEQARIDNARPMLVIGDLAALHIRAQVDEEDIALVKAGAKAVGRTRGAVIAEVPLTIVRIEPYARAKTQLSGSNIERVDTRVIEVVLAVQGTPSHPIYPGQAIDVYIESVP